MACDGSTNLSSSAFTSNPFSSLCSYGFAPYTLTKGFPVGFGVGKTTLRPKKGKALGSELFTRLAVVGAPKRLKRLEPYPMRIPPRPATFMGAPTPRAPLVILFEFGII